MAVPPCPEPVVSIVIVTYGTGEVVLDALASVVAHTTIPYEVVVVDNPRGRDATRDLLRRSTSGVILLTPDENLGFGGGNDAGVEMARGRYVCFLNPDVIVGEGWLEPLVAALDDPAVAIAAPPLLDPDGSLQEAGQSVYADGCTAAIGGPELFPGDTGQLFDRDVDYASAACWLVRRHEHVERGGFDPRFHPAFFEDADYALRVERAGQVTRLVTASPVVHHRGQGGAGRDLAMGERGLAVFRSVHAEDLVGRPPRPADVADEAGAVELRDHRCGRRRVLAVRAGAAHGVVRDAFESVLADAAASPRERATLVVAERGMLADDDLQRAARVGLEVVVGDVDRAMAIRRSPRLGEAEVSVIGPSPARRRVPMVATVAAIALAGVVARWIVLRSPAGRLNADEAYTGIESFEILAGRLPVVLGGTAYTAVFESYLYAPLVAVFGAHILPLKLIATGFWAFAALVIAAIAHDVVRGATRGSARRTDPRASARRAAVVAGGLAWVAPGALLTVSTNAYESYASGMATTAVAFWLARRVVDYAEPGWRLPGVLGVFAGLGFWMHPMFLSTLVPVVLVVLVIHRRQPIVWEGVIVGGLIGCGPFLVWNAVNGWPSLTSPVDVEGTYGERLTTFLDDLVPRAFGLRDGALTWMLGPVVGPMLYAVLLGAVVVGVVLAVRADRRPSRVLLPVVLVLVFPAMAVFPPLIFAADGRYGVVAFPFLLVALAVAVTGLADVVARSGRPWSTPSMTPALGRAVAFGAVAVLWLGAFLGPHVRLLLDETGRGPGGGPNAPIVEVADRIRSAGIEHVHGSYWRVLPVELASDRELTGAVLAPLPVRFPERQQVVDEVLATAPERVAYVFQPDDDDPSRLPLPPDAYDRQVIADTVLYLPVAAAGPVSLRSANP
ncbi:MAG: glycosyltransferase family 2 protein [Ilumatobacteraceae bacterium]